MDSVALKQEILTGQKCKKGGILNKPEVSQRKSSRNIKLLNAGK
jgi:hypothetical protein